jgi:hypothetical protein
VLAAIRGADDLRMSIEDAAAMIFRSTSHFAHLFKQQVGLPFRRYMAMAEARARHSGDRARAHHRCRRACRRFRRRRPPHPHLLRDVRDAPSVMMRGEFFEIPSPFELPAAPERRG